MNYLLNMDIKLTKQSPSTLSESTVIPVFSAEKPGKSLHSQLASSSWKAIEKLDSKLNGQLVKGLKKKDFKPSKGKHCTVLVTNKSKACSITLIAYRKEDQDLAKLKEQLRELGASLAKSSEQHSCLSLAHIKNSNLQDYIKAVAEGVLIGSYSFKLYKKSKSKAPKRVVEIALKSEPTGKLKAVVKEAYAINSGQDLARDLVNTPAGDMGPKEIVQAAKKIARGTSSQMSIKVFGKSALKKMKAGSLLSVTAGSSTEPYLIHMDYKPKRKAKETIALVGKGITFDSGGLSIKSSRGMMTMKCDMGGAGAVLGIMEAIAKLPASAKPKCRIHALVPTCENMVSANSTHPGDVVKAMDGKTIEVLNTDAEGRLILADAFCYSKKLKADKTIDFATLTGACVAALGDRYAGLFSNESTLAEALHRHGEETGDNLWPLPLAEEYDAYLNSDIADVKNIGNPGPGAVTAALFLRRFVPNNTDWAHIDLAGPAFLDGRRGIYQKGATGFPVRALVSFLRES